MKFLLDHDVPDDLAFSLGALGHPVVKVREIMPATATDDEVLHVPMRRNVFSLPATATILSP